TNKMLPRFSQARTVSGCLYLREVEAASFGCTGTIRLTKNHSRSPTWRSRLLKAPRWTEPWSQLGRHGAYACRRGTEFCSIVAPSPGTALPKDIYVAPLRSFA